MNPTGHAGAALAGSDFMPNYVDGQTREPQTHECHGQQHNLLREQRAAAPAVAPGKPQHAQRQRGRRVRRNGLGRRIVERHYALLAGLPGLRARQDLPRGADRRQNRSCSESGGYCSGMPSVGTG